ncbi:THAP-type domain-containing protein, partial [Aphis craccivora]
SLEWTRVCQKGFISTKFSVLCSEHFLPSDFKINSGRSYRFYLKDSAVPSISTGPTFEEKNPKRNKFEIVETYLELNEELPLDLSTVTKNDLTSPVKNDSLTNVNTIYVLSTPSTKTIIRPLFSPVTNRKRTEPDTPRKIHLARKNKKIKNLEDLLKNLRSKGLLDDQCGSLLSDKFKTQVENQLAVALPKALKYCRTFMKLPNGEPGFFKEVFTILKNLNPDDKHCILWDEKLQKFVGNCDYGNEIDIEGIDNPASEVLVFMLILGCEFGSSYDDIKCWFEHPISKTKIFFILDVCHMLKLARNTLANNLVLESEKGFIRWGHIKQLFNVQKEVVLKLSNKLSMAHIAWFNNKMKVKYAAQTLSSSTADSLQYLQSTHFPNFENFEATIQYCRIIARIFDFLNSKSKFSKGFKSPIFSNNIMKLEEIIVPLIKYLFTLKFKDSLLYTSNKKTFIIGFTIAAKSVLSLSKQFFSQHTNFSYLLTYKFSQDHLELLFGRIRQRFSSNNNPNVFQFKTAIKQILMKNSIKCQSNFNCNTFDDEPIGSLFEYKWSKKKKEIDYDKEVVVDEIDNIALKKVELL